MQELVSSLRKPRVIWLMAPHGKIVEGILFGAGGLSKILSRGDTVIDGANSYFKDSVRRAQKIEKSGIRYLDVGVSGGPLIAKQGACLMVGGKPEAFKRTENLFRDIAGAQGYQFFKGAGAGHFVKMVHNGIEYGMMQALAEGLAILKKSPYKPNLKKAAENYNKGSIIESRLVNWARQAFEDYGENLSGVSGSVAHTGEGEWTAKTARELGITAPIIEESFKFRLRSKKNPSFTGKVLSALRAEFGGHSAK
jgi:6-phosphogluconate dehydrogenase